MPCSFLLALALLTAPECFSSLAETTFPWNPQAQQAVIVQTVLPKTENALSTDDSLKATPAVAEKPNPAESLVAKAKSENRPRVIPAIAERAPKQGLPQVNNDKDIIPAIAQKSLRLPAPVTEVDPMDLSSIALDTPQSVAHAPAIAERAPKKSARDTNPNEWQQVAQAWPTLPTHVRSEILRLVQNAD